jgi:hypothetical protein
MAKEIITHGERDDLPLGVASRERVMRRPATSQSPSMIQVHVKSCCNGCLLATASVPAERVFGHDRS